MVISSSVLVKESELWFASNHLCVEVMRYMRLDGSCGLMAKVKAMSQVEYVTHILKDRVYPGRHQVDPTLGRRVMWRC